MRSVCDEIEQLISEFGAKNFYFVDENFLGRCRAGQERGLAFAKEVVRRGLDIRFSILCRVDDVERSLFSSLKDAGLQRVSVGIESFSENSLQLYNKQIVQTDIINCCSVLNSLGIKTYFGWIMFQPFVTITDLKENLAFMAKYYDSLEVRAYFSRLMIHPHTSIAETLSKNGVLEIRYSGEGFKSLSYRFTDNRIQRIWDLLLNLRRKYAATENAVKKAYLYWLDIDITSMWQTSQDVQDNLTVASQLDRQLYWLWHSMFYRIIEFVEQEISGDFREPVFFSERQKEIMNSARLLTS